jgi:site-specific recombinase XerD
MDAARNAWADAANHAAEPRDLSHHFSQTTKNRTVSKIKKYYKYFRIPGIGQLAGGKIRPNRARHRP